MRRIHVRCSRVRTVVVARVEVEVAAGIGQDAATNLGARTPAAERLPVGAGLVRPDGVPLPATQHIARKSIAGVREPGQLVNIVDDHPVTDVVDGIPTIQEGLSLVGGESLSGTRPVGRCGATVPG